MRFEHSSKPRHRAYIPLSGLGLGPRHYAPHLAACAMAVLGTACGGGGDAPPGTTPALNSGQTGGTAPGTPGAPTASLAVTLALPAEGGNAASNAVALGKPLEIVATVRDQTGKAVENALLSVAVDNQLLVMTPTRGQVATDAAGKAKVMLAPAGIVESGPTLVKVLAQSGGLSASAETLLTVAKPALSLRQILPQANPAQVAALGSAVVVLDVLNNGTVLGAVPVTLNLRSVCADAGRATLPASVTTTQGRAQFTYQDKGCAQADSIAASVEGGSVSAAIGLTVASQDAASIVLGDITPTDKSIVIQGAGGNGRAETASVGFRVLDKTGTPLANQAVSFSTISTKPVRLGQTSGVTDADGRVSVNLSSGAEPTAVRVAAKLANGLNTVSDSITVTTGLPTQLAFSLSAKEFNIEGYDYDDVTNEIKLLLADQFGNPVADGVPVVMQTDSGAIGSADRGGCLTSNGRCTVELRSQNPRYEADASAPRRRAGLATVSVTTLANAQQPLTGEIAVFFSGSRVGNVSLVGSPSGVTLADGKLSINASGCGATNVALRLSDARRNPMPAGSTLAFDAAVGLSGTASPSAVPSVAPLYTGSLVLNDQGSVHTIAVTPDAATCDASGTSTANGSANLVLTTPFNNTSLIPLAIRYKSK